MIIKIVLGIVLINQVISVISALCSETDVKTTSGVIRGKTVKYYNQTINQYLGIPYAEPPIGKLRFTKSKPLQKQIQGIYHATHARNSCMQPELPPFFEKYDNLTFNEDCLTLNIWSPKTTNVSELKPVMFWIHGGGLIYGSIYQFIGYNGTVLATHDIVLVTVNYRLGALGFLYGATEDSPGNLGFYDQLLALKWVRENIHLFGGDKNQITIFGESAGSWSVSVHVLSPLSRGLFRRAIMESGAQLYNKSRSILTTREALQQSKQMAKHFNCTEDNKWLDCLRSIDANSFVNYIPFTLYPLEGTEFLPISAQKSFIQHLYSSDIDLIAGVTKDEGSLLSYYAYEQLRRNMTLKDFKDIVADSSAAFHDISVEKVSEHYLKNVDTNNSDALKKAFYDYRGDIIMKCPTYQFAKQFAENTPTKRTYFYEMTYISKETAQGMGCHEETMGICHGADVEMIFGVPIWSHKKRSQIDKDFSSDIMKMWTNFVKTGDPGSNWPQLIDHGSSVVKVLHPYDLNSIFVDPFKVVCEDLRNSVYNF